MRALFASKPVQAEGGIARLPHGQINPRRGDVRIVVISDLNSQYGSTTYAPEVHRALAIIPDWQPQLVLCGGDMIAAQSKALSTDQVQQMWAAFDRTVATPLRQAQIPFGFTLGNHDASGFQTASGQYTFARDRDLARSYWQRSRQACGLNFVDAAHFPFYYTFQLKHLFCLVWDASTAQISRNQLDWVESSLAQAPPESVRLVIGHLPLYAVAEQKNKPGEVLHHAEALRSLLERHGVHTYISGHHHAYYPAEKGKLHLLYAGALGGGPRSLMGSTLAPYKSMSVVDIYLALRRTRTTTYNLATLEIVDHRTLPSQITGLNGTIYRQAD
ncbi:metallophosphoesterase family protein [Lyngbya confervoides]|uniref:Metallophosphoesterase n=1 Tax=Lyngbya confervoides BDU141951 TaxID=1574623 RepID=A0ABD4T7C7_9CYAN|nr:metallophosphoesterase [Lyngbya confervoides]MCM1984160.1 metallophosphoesterase [Lyngbya confervoides BDU141951]